MPDTESTDQSLIPNNTQPAGSLSQGQLDNSLSNENPLQTISRHFTTGVTEVANQYHAVDLMNNESIPDAKRLQALSDGAQKISSGYNQAQYESESWYQKMADDSAQMAPTLGDNLIKGAEGAGGGLVAGAGIGAAIGGLAGSIVPGAGNAVGAGGGALAGAELGKDLGWMMGEGYSAWSQNAGQMYSDLRLNGIDHQTAKPIAYTIGAINGALQVVGLKFLGNAAGNALSRAEMAAIKSSLSNPYVKHLETNMASRMGMDIAKSTVVGTVGGTTQGLMNEIGKFVAQSMQKGNTANFTNWKEASKHIYETFLRSLQMSLTLGAAGVLGGHVAGKAAGEVKVKIKDLAKPLNENFKGQSALDIIKKVNEAVHELPDEWEKEQQGKFKLTIKYDEHGNPYIETKAGNKEYGPPKTTNDLGQLKLKDIVENPQSLIQAGLQAIYPQEERELTPGEVQTGMQTKVYNPDEFEGFQEPSPGNEEPMQLRMSLRDWRPLNPTEVRSRINQITSDMKILQKEESRLEKQISKDEEMGNLKQNTVKHWRGVTNQLEALASEKEMLESGLGIKSESGTHNPHEADIKMGTTQNQGHLQGKQKISVLNKLFDENTKLAQKLVDQKEKGQTQLKLGIQKAEYRMEKGIRRVQANLRNLVKEVTQDPETGKLLITNADAQRLQRHIGGITTPEQALTASVKIKAEAQKFMHTKLSAELESQRGKTFQAVVKNLVRVLPGNGAHPTSGVPADLVPKLEILKGFLKNKKTLDDYRGHFAIEHGATPVDQLPADIAFKNELANMANDLYRGDPMTVNIVAAKIAQWIQNGEKIIAQKKEQTQQRADRVRDTAKQSLGVEKAKAQGKEWSKQTSQRFIDAVSSTVAPWLPFRRMTDLMGPDKKLTALLDDTKERSNYLRHSALAHINLLSYLGGREVYDRLNKDENSAIQIKFTKADGSQSSPEIFSRAQIIDAVMKMKDESLHAALRDTKTGNGWTLTGDVKPGESMQERMESTLDDSDRKTVDNLLDFYKDYYVHINKTYRERNGVDLPMRENYSPVSRKGYKVEGPYSEDGMKFWDLLPGSAKTRQDSLLAIEPRNPYQDAMNHMNQWEYYKHMGEKLHDFQTVLNDPEIRSHIQGHFGTGTIEVLDKYHEAFMLNDPLPNQSNNGLWAALQADYSKHVLGYRPVTSFLRQLTAGPGMLANYSPKQIAEAIPGFFTRMKETQGQIGESPMYKQQIKQGASFDVQNAMGHQGVFGATLSKLLGQKEEASTLGTILNKFAFMGDIAGDAAVFRIFGGIQYNIERNLGKTPEEALTAVERTMNDTQEGASIASTPRIFDNGPLSSIALQFTRQPIRMASNTAVHLADFLNSNKTPHDWMMLGHRVASQWALPGALLASVRSAPMFMFPQNEDEQRKREQIWDLIGGTILGPGEGIPIIGGLVKAAWMGQMKNIMGTDKTSQMAEYQQNNPLSEGYLKYKQMLSDWNQSSKLNDSTDISTTIKRVLDPNYRDKADQSLMKAQQSTVELASELLGLPQTSTSLPYSVTQRLRSGDYAGAAMAMGGWTPGVLNKRKSPTEGMSDIDVIQKQNKKMMKDILHPSQSEAPYDTLMKNTNQVSNYLQNYLLHKNPPDPLKEQQTNHSIVKTYLNGVTGSDRINNGQ